MRLCLFKLHWSTPEKSRQAVSLYHLCIHLPMQQPRLCWMSSVQKQLLLDSYCDPPYVTGKLHLKQTRPRRKRRRAALELLPLQIQCLLLRGLCSAFSMRRSLCNRGRRGKKSATFVKHCRRHKQAETEPLTEAPRWLRQTGYGRP